jgi:hypothetical protein
MLQCENYDCVESFDKKADSAHCKQSVNGHQNASFLTQNSTNYLRSDTDPSCVGRGPWACSATIVKWIQKDRIRVREKMKGQDHCMR